jgi:hypothetical protein
VSIFNLLTPRYGALLFHENFKIQKHQKQTGVIRGVLAAPERGFYFLKNNFDRFRSGCVIFFWEGTACRGLLLCF